MQRQTFAVQNSKVTRRQLADFLQNRSWTLDISEFDIFTEGRRRNRQSQARQMTKDCKLRAENEAAGIFRKKERFFSQAIPAEYQPLFWLVPNCEGKHTAQFLEQTFAPAFVSVQQNFSVAAALKIVALRLQFFS